MSYPNYYPQLNRTVTICGSMRLFESMLALARQLTIDGYLVLMPFVFMKDDDPNADRLHKMHLDKIELSCIVYVLTEGGYIGKTTQEEIDYAKREGKEIRYVELMLAEYQPA